MNSFRHRWSDLRSTFWFLPFLIVLICVVYAVVLIQIDYANVPRWQSRMASGYLESAQKARVICCLRLPVR